MVGYQQSSYNRTNVELKYRIRSALREPHPVIIVLK